MSGENMELMREAYRAFSGGELMALAGLLDPEIEWRAVEDPETRRGVQGVVESLGSWFEVWEDVQVELEELIDAGQNVVAVVKLRGRHAGSQSEVSERFFQVWTIRDEKIVAFREFKTEHDALEAAGIER
jgi:ketosteroid isomerase-like protein